MDTTKLKDRLEDKARGLQNPVEVENAALTPSKSGYLALTNNALDVIRANLKNQPLSRCLSVSPWPAKADSSNTPQDF